MMNCVYLSFQGVFAHSDQVTWVLVAMQGEDTHSMVMEDEECCKRSVREGARMKGMKQGMYVRLYT